MRRVYHDNGFVGHKPVDYESRGKSTLSGSGEADSRGGQSSRRMRSASATWSSVWGDTRPRSDSSLLVLIDRSASHRMYDRAVSPPSGGSTGMCEGIGRRVRVNGMANTSP